MSDREVMQQALEALSGVAQWVEQWPATHPWDAWQKVAPAIAALEAALAEPEPEPVAPPARRPLTDADIDEVITIAGVYGVRGSIRKIIRVAERAHGITGDDDE